MPCIWNDWLPKALSDEIKKEEPKRFARLIDHICSEWRPEADAEQVNKLLSYVPLVRAMLDAKADPGVVHMQRLAETLFDMVLCSEGDLTVQARWGGILHRILRTHGKKMSLRISWKPLYSMLRRHHLVCSCNYEGAGVMEARRQALVHLLHQSRRFFHPETAQEVWEHFKPALMSDPHSTEAFESLGWLCMILPTQEATKGQGDWAVWMREWMDIWGRRVHNQTWQSLWFSLVARLAKHDVHGLVDWHSIMGLMVNRFLWAFNVPVGPASAVPPFSAGAPAIIEALFANDMQSRSASIAKALMYSIGRENLTPGAMEMDSRDPGVLCLETVVAMFEQYYHPSNGGKWSSSLAMFMRELAFHLCRRLVAEHSVLVSSCDIGVDSGGESEEEPSDEDDDESMGTAEEGVDSSVTDEDIAVGGMNEMEASSTPKNGHFPRRHLSAETRRTVVKLVMRLALKGQSGKDSIMRRYSSQVLSMLANIEPQIVLPEVERHFVTALETITAAKQYGNAIHTLSLCARPMLLAGIPSLPADMNEGEEEDSISVHKSNAIQCIRTALTSTLPGIDANDPPKSLAVFRLYCCVLSCVGPLDDVHVCLYSEEWVIDLLARIFTVLSNLDSPEGGGEHTSQHEEESSFLLDGNSMFRPLVELLFARVHRDLRKRAIKQTAEFLLGNTFSSVAPEAAILCNSMAWADAEETEKQILVPLISMLLEECDIIERCGQDFFGRSASQLSKVQETTLAWRLGLMSSLVFHMGVQASVHEKDLTRIFSVLLKFPSPIVQSAASRCLSSLLVGLVSFYPQHQYATMSVKVDEISLEPFVDKFGDWDLLHHDEASALDRSKDSVLPAWHEPCESEIGLAEQILATFLVEPAARLRDLASQSHPINKQEIRYLLNSMEGVIEGARSCLPDFEELQKPAGDEAAAIVGKIGVSIGTSEVRPQVVEALVSISKLVDTSDVETLTILLRLLDSVLAVGAAEYHSSDSSATAWASDDRWLQQPAVAGFLSRDEGVNSLAWRRRRPRWVAIEKVFMNLEWRASQAAYRSFASISDPWLSLKKLPKVYIDALGVSIHYMLRGGSALRDVAGSIVERSAKRFPLLTEYIYAPVCAGMAKVTDPIQFDLTVSCSDLIPVLLHAAEHSASRAAEAAASGVPESEAEQSMGIGATTLMRWVSGWRYFTRNYSGFRALVLSMIASFAYTGPEVQVSMTMTQVMFALRSMRPLGVDASDVADQICLDCIQLVHGSSTSKGADLSGRQETIVALFPLFILPDITPELSKKLIVFYAKELVSDTPLSRKVAMVAIVIMLLPLWRPYYDESFTESTPKMQDDAIQACREGLKQFLDDHGESMLPKLMQMMSISHHALATLTEDENSRRMRIIGANKEDTVITAVLSTLMKGLEWPSSPSAFKDIAKGSFTVRHARIIQVLAQVNPSVVMMSLRAPIESILNKPQDDDKPATAAAAEVCAGLLASGVVFDRGSYQESCWTAWMGKVFTEALENAPFDFLNIWGDCVLRFAVNGLKEKGMDTEYVPRITEAALGKKPINGSIISVSDVHKRVIYFTELLQEVTGGCLGTIPRPQCVRQIEQDMLMSCLNELPMLIEKGCETDISRQAVAGLMADVCILSLTENASGGAGSADRKAALESKVREMMEGLYHKFDLVVDYFYNHKKDTALNETEHGMDQDLGGIEEGRALSDIAFVCELTYQLLASASSTVTPFLIRPMNSIMRSLELIPSESQFVGTTARLALRTLKYQPLEPENVALCLRNLLKSSQSALWTERAVSLQFMQYFWFRNAILLGEEGSLTVLKEAMRLLEDSKLEVRDMACATVSGVIKVITRARQAEYRNYIMAQSTEVFPDRKRRRRTPSGKLTASVAIRHGAVLGLKALVMSSPYDVPEWLPEVLMSLVRLASEPDPVRSTVRESLSEFRRTHEEGGLLAIKDVISAEHWEAIRDVATPANYFV